MKILVATAYVDDETLGCGGTMAHLVEEGHAVRVVFGTDGVEGRISTPNSPPRPDN
jgi:LmbE family N-acetylglucosaminyl deacetylase